MFQMDNVQFFFGLLELAFEPGDLLLVWLFALLKLDLEKGKLLHGFLDSLFVFVEHAVGGPVLGFEGFVEVF